MIDSVDYIIRVTRTPAGEFSVKLHPQAGNVRVTAPGPQGPAGVGVQNGAIILKSPNGTEYKLSVSNAGELITTLV